MSIVTPKTFKTYSLGCRVNQAEMEAISRQLVTKGYALCQTKDQPDIVLLNTCAVTQKAEFETRKEIRKLKRLYPQSFLVVLGCTVTAQEKYNIVLPQADLLVSNEAKQRVIDLLEEKFGSKPADLKQISQSKYILSGRKFIKVQEGCDNFCTFCLTACLRGKPTSVPLPQIIEEINYWESQGIKEIILTGINISLYGKDSPKQESVTSLIEKILCKTRIERISLSSIYPQMLTPDFLDLTINNPRISQYFHLSIQSGSQSVLQRMNRKTNLNKLGETLKQIKAKNQSFTFRADFIAGFPDEAKEEFEETLQFIKENKISFVHAFPFSKRKGTAAFEMIEKKAWKDLPSQTKKERVKKVMETVKQIRQQEAERLINQISNCLIVRGDEAITHNGWPLRLRLHWKCSGQAINKGQIVPVKITAFENDQLGGEFIYPEES
ncbi:MAG: MiaB/RimO family radical SAM methylthiotransferase [Patescibacteria group bacterium]